MSSYKALKYEPIRPDDFNDGRMLDSGITYLFLILVSRGIIRQLRLETAIFVRVDDGFESSSVRTICVPRLPNIYVAQSS